MSETTFPQCLKCNKGVLIPLSNFGAFEHGAVEQRYKVWVCNNPACHYTIGMEKQNVVVGHTALTAGVRK